MNMRANTPNKVQATRVQQALKALDVGVRNYLSDRDPDLKELVITSNQELLRLIEEDWMAFREYRDGRFRDVTINTDQ